MIKINKQELRLLAERYNSDGKQAMYAFLQTEYGIKNPTCTFKRMKKHTELGYNPETDRFLFDNKSCASEDMDLCQYLGHKKLNFSSLPNRQGDIVLSCKSLILNLLWCLVSKGTVTPFSVVK